MDVSSLKELEQLGAEYYKDGEKRELLGLLKEYGTNAVRLRLWNDPYSESGVPYGAGTNDLKTTEELGRRALALGLDVLLDLHYSDFWADPGKQRVPKAWRGMDMPQLEQAGLCGEIHARAHEQHQHGRAPDKGAHHVVQQHDLFHPHRKSPFFRLSE